MKVDLSAVGMRDLDSKLASGLDVGKVFEKETGFYQTKVENLESVMISCSKKGAAFASVFGALEDFKFGLDQLMKPGFEEKVAKTDGGEFLEVTLRDQNVDVSHFTVAGIHLASRYTAHAGPFPSGAQIGENGSIAIVHPVEEVTAKLMDKSDNIYYLKGPGRDTDLFTIGLDGLKVSSKDFVGAEFQVGAISVSVDNDKQSGDKVMSVDIEINGESFKSDPYVFARFRLFEADDSLTFRGNGLEFVVTNKNQFNIGKNQDEFVDGLRIALDGLEVVECRRVESDAQEVQKAYLDFAPDADAIQMKKFRFLAGQVIASIAGQELSFDLSQADIIHGELQFVDNDDHGFVVFLNDSIYNSGGKGGEELVALLNLAFGVQFETVISLDLLAEDTLESVAQKLNDTELISSYVLSTESDSGDHLMMRSVIEGSDGYSVVDRSGLLKLAAENPGSDAEMRFDGNLVLSPLNTLEALAGALEIQLKADSPDDRPIKIMVDYDYQGVAERLRRFVDDYNQLRSVLDVQVRRDASGKLADESVLNYNPAFSDVVAELEAALAFRFQSYTLADLGIERASGNRLQFVEDRTLRFEPPRDFIALADACISNWRGVLRGLLSPYGALNRAVNQLASEQARHGDAMRTMQRDLASRRRAVVDKYSDLEAKISTTNYMLEMLENQTKSYYGQR